MSIEQERIRRTERWFLRDTEGFVCEVLHDHGLYRHIYLHHPETSACHYHITTWPGYLCFSGDMGTFVFHRVPDMLAFFRKEQPNYQYWHEKLQGICKADGSQEFSPELVAEYVADVFREHDFRAEVQETDKSAYIRAAELWWRIQIHLLGGLHEMSEAEAITQLIGFNSPYSRIDFQGAWEIRTRVYSHRFIWCCLALVKAVRMYDQAKPG